MCTRYNLTSPLEAVRSYFGASGENPFPPRYNIAPTQPVAIIRLDPNGAREIALVRWGLIPSWTKDPKALKTLVNARGESTAEKPSFRGAMRHRRCLVPANGFYEWTGKPGARQPHLIRRSDGGLMAFAGLWESWLGADGSEIDTMAILTVAANAALAGSTGCRRSSSRRTSTLAARIRAEMAAEMLRPAANDLLEHMTVDPRLNNARNEGADLIRPFGERLL